MNALVWPALALAACLVKGIAATTTFATPPSESEDVLGDMQYQFGDVMKIAWVSDETAVDLYAQVSDKDPRSIGSFTLLQRALQVPYYMWIIDFENLSVARELLNDEGYATLYLQLWVSAVGNSSVTASRPFNVTRRKSTTTTTGASSILGATSTAVGSLAPTATASSVSGEKSPSEVVIAGAVVGGVGGVLIIVTTGLFIWWALRKRRQAHGRPQNVASRAGSGSGYQGYGTPSFPAELHNKGKPCEAPSAPPVQLSS